MNTFRFSAAVIMSIVYDYEVALDHDHLVELFERGNTLALENLTPEASAFSFRKWSPFLQWYCPADQHLSPQFARVVPRCRHETQGSSFQALCYADDNRTL
jgi:hypothetical protein